jgi:hypothetical protein
MVLGARLRKGLACGLVGALALGLSGCFFNLRQSPDFKRWYVGEPGLAGALGEPRCDAFADKITGARHPAYLHLRLPEVLLQPQGGTLYPERSTARRLAGAAGPGKVACEIIPPGEETFTFVAVDAGLLDTLVPYRRLTANPSKSGWGRRIASYFGGLLYNTGVAVLMKAPIYLVHDVLKTVYLPVAGAYFLFRDETPESAVAQTAAPGSLASTPAAPAEALRAEAAAPAVPQASPAASGAPASPVSPGLAAEPVAVPPASPETSSPPAASSPAPQAPAATPVAGQASDASPQASDEAAGTPALPESSVPVPAAEAPPFTPPTPVPARLAVLPPPLDPRPIGRGELRKMAALGAFPALSPTFDPDLRTHFQQHLEERLAKACRRVELVGPEAATFPEVLDRVPRDLFGRLDSRTVTVMARQLGFNVYVTGSILDATVSNEARGVLWYRDTEGRLRVAVLVEIFDAASGTMLLNRTFVEYAQVDELAPGYSGGLRDTDLPAVRQTLGKIAEDMGEAICEALDDLPWRAFVLAADEDHVTLSAGSASGLQPGHVLTVYSSQIIQGLNDQPFFLTGPRVGRIQVLRVEDRRSEARVLEGSGFAPDQLVAPEAR